MPNALLPTTTLVALNIGFVVYGAITIETVFSIPGLGLLATEAIKTATGMATQLASQGMQTMEVASQQVQRASSMAAAAAPRKAASKTSRAGAAPEAPSAAAKAPRRSTARKAGE